MIFLAESLVEIVTHLVYLLVDVDVARHCQQALLSVVWLLVLRFLSLNL
jgi:hypothetical protein